MNKTALILGVTGQDGSYLARLLLEKGYTVFGASRDAEMASFSGLRRLGLLDQVRVLSVAPTDFRSVLQAIHRTRPDEIYNLSGQSSVGLSFDQPVETLESIVVGTQNCLEAIRFLGNPVRFYNACSSESFGNTGDAPASETTPFRPRSPYGVAKAAAFWQVANYREAYGVHACSGILFNHESPLRPKRFVTQKIVEGARRIAAGDRRKLALGNLDVARDWGWAPEYVEAMWSMVQQPQPDDFVIATGEPRSLREFVDAAFTHVGLSWREWVVEDPALLRLTDIPRVYGDPSKARRVLGWEARFHMEEVVRGMMDAEPAA